MLKQRRPPRFDTSWQLFLWVWQHRKHVSEVSGKPLGDTAMSYYFAHCLPKSLSTRFKMRPVNIVLMTWDEHDKYDNHADAARQDPRFDWVFKLREHLRKQ